MRSPENQFLHTVLHVLSLTLLPTERSTTSTQDFTIHKAEQLTTKRRKQKIVQSSKLIENNKQYNESIRQKSWNRQAKEILTE